jgi:hypothetical protein
MKSAIFSLIICIAAAVPVFAQDLHQHCYKPDSDTTVCEFSPSGRVNIASVNPDGTYDSTWYTRSEFQHFKTTEAGRLILHLRTPSNHKSEAQAQSWRSQDYCEADGFVWHDGGCHAVTK